MPELSVLSFNIMFNDVYLFERHNQMIKEILSLKDVDVICFQEVLYEVAQYLNKNLKKSFFPVFETIQLEEMSYGVMIFVRNNLIVQDKTVTKIPTKMGRALLHAEILKNEVMYNIVTFHLESLNSSETRKEQFNILMKTFGKFQNVIMCGDTNITNDEKYELPPNILDVAVEAKDETSTYWGSRFWNSGTHYRYDRMYCSNTLTDRKYSRLFNVQSENDFKWLSDHDGIISTFSHN